MSSNKISRISSRSTSYKASNSRSNSIGSSKSSSKVAQPKRVLPSRRISINPTEGKSCYSATITSNLKARPKKTTKSDQTFSETVKPEALDHCRNCGDTQKPQKTETLISKTNPKPQKPRLLTKSLHQYYKNEHYRPSTESVRNFAKKSLATIKEASEAKSSADTFITVDSNSSDSENLEDVKEFRRNNYFECHSSKFRSKTKPSATCLGDHICVYRFYLDKRLFPKPLSTDHKGTARCVECHLPMAYQPSSTKINGTIQVKVNLDNKIVDSTILLPVNLAMIPQQRKKEVEEDVMYFGVINLDSNGHSVFNPTTPENSFALKYQSGFRQFDGSRDYRYDQLEKNDAIVI